MRKLILGLMIIVSVFSLQAQTYLVGSIRGKTEYLQKDEWVSLELRDHLKSTDTVRIGKNAQLVVIEETQKRLFSIGEHSAATLGSMVSPKRRSPANKLVTYMAESIRRGDTEKISHEANTVYKGENEDKQIYAALTSANYQSAYSLSMQLIDVETSKEITNSAKIDDKFFFRITNEAEIPLFVNVLDVSSDNILYDCFPIDAAGVMLHLLVPAQSTIDFTEYPMRFSEPAGIDRLRLIASSLPFDLRNITGFYEENKRPDKAGKVGLCEVKINVTNK